MKLIHEFRTHWGDCQHQLVALRDDGVRVESGWQDETNPASLSDAAITHGHVVEEDPHGGGYVAFTDYHPELPEVSRYDPFPDVKTEDLGVVDDDENDGVDSDEEDADEDK
jgi:hypothetical protein